MGCIMKGAIASLVVGFIVTLFWDWGPPSPPKLKEINWRNVTHPDKSIRPFKIVYNQKDDEDLIRRLKATRTLSPSFPNSGWHYGINSKYLHAVVEYWLTHYEYKLRVDYMNFYPQFVTNIQGLDIQYIHVKPENAHRKRVLPLLILHGWPGSILEFFKILPLLTTPQPRRDFVFEVIAPSLPGFGYSQAATKPGLGAVEMSLVMKNLMGRLGHNTFYVQGGDWGSMINAAMAVLYPENVIGMHSNMCNNIRPLAFLEVMLYSFFPSLLLPKEDQHLLYPFTKKLAFLLEESGYLHIQATKPDTVGSALNDSPAGLTGYILEKFSTGTNPDYRNREDGGVLQKFQSFEIIDNIVYYWMSNSITTSMRIYAETFNRKMLKMNMEAQPIKVPTACAQFPHEITYLPESILKRRYVNLLRVTKMPRGGHFAALEEPQLLADDIWESVEEMEIWRKKKIINST